jgi:glutamine phosphoribosylpyrophosphate amidotransferase
MAVAENLADKTVIIVDDTYGSGGTMEETTRACRSAGAKEVLGLTATKNAKSTQGIDISDWPWG